MTTRRAKDHQRKSTRIEVGKRRLNKPANKECTVVLGDSMVKGIKGWEISDKDHKVVVKTFSRASTNDMKSYVKPTLERNPEIVILHSGTNDLKLKKDEEEIVNNIVNLALSIKNNNNTVVISGLIHRADSLNEKVGKVNSLLSKECNDRNIGFIKHDNIIPRKHLNRGGLHLTKEGNNIFSENILFILNNLWN